MSITLQFYKKIKKHKHNYFVILYDNIWCIDQRISDKENVDPVLLGLYNDFGKLKLVSGQEMTIPKSNVYTVRSDDTVDSVLAATNKSAIELLRANASTWLKTGNKIYL